MSTATRPNPLIQSDSLDHVTYDPEAASLSRVTPPGASSGLPPGYLDASTGNASLSPAAALAADGPASDGPDLSAQYASDEETVRYIQQNVFPALAATRMQRSNLENEWHQIRRMGLLQHDEGQSYTGRSNVYIPAYAHARDVLISTISRGLFPSDDYMDVTPMDIAEGTPTEGEPKDQESDSDGQDVKQYLQYELDKCARLRTKIKPLLKQLVQYGIGVGKMWYHKELKAKTKLKKTQRAQQVIPSIEVTSDTSKEGVRFQSRDIFSFYVWPPTCDSLEEASIIFEDISSPLAYIRSVGKTKGWVNLDKAENAPTPVEFQQNRQRHQLDNMKESSTPEAGGGALAVGEVAAERVLTEIWCAIQLPVAAYIEGEDSELPLNVRIIMAGDTVVDVKRSPFLCRPHPYFVSRMTCEPGQFYPKGTGFSARGLQYLVNDFANQINDNMTYGLVPVALVNPAMMAGLVPGMKPGAVWPVNDINQAVKFDRPPVEQVQYGGAFVDRWTSALNDAIGAPPIMQGTNAGKGARTATSAQILQKNASNPIQDIVEDIEGDVMQPLMEFAHALGQQYRTSDVDILVDGKAKRITPAMLHKDCAYRWLASSQSANSQQRTQGLLGFLQTIVPLQPLLAQQGKAIDPIPVLQKMWTDGLGQRNFKKLIIAAPPPPAMGPGAGPGGPPPPGMPPGMGAGPVAGMDPNSMDPNQSGDPSDSGAEPGSGDDFANVRDQADQIAAQFGAGNQ